MVSSQETAAFLALLVSRRKDIPKSECLIACASDDGGSIGTHGQVEHSVGVAGESGNFLHIWVLPYVYLVVRVPMGRDDFIEILTEHEVAHLRAHIHGLESAASERVSEPDCPVCCASP